MLHTITQQDNTEVISERFDPCCIPAHAGLDRFISNLKAELPAEVAKAR